MVGLRPGRAQWRPDAPVPTASPRRPARTSPSEPVGIDAVVQRQAVREREQDRGQGIRRKLRRDRAGESLLDPTTKDCAAACDTVAETALELLVLDCSRPDIGTQLHAGPVLGAAEHGLGEMPQSAGPLCIWLPSAAAASSTAKSSSTSAYSRSRLQVITPTPYRTPLPGVYLYAPLQRLPAAVYTECAVITLHALHRAIVSYAQRLIQLRIVLWGN